MMDAVQGDLDLDAEAADVYESLFRAHYLSVRSYLRQAWPAVDEDEVLSRTFETAWRRLDDIPADVARGWLIGVARNHALNTVRSSRRRRSRMDALAALPGAGAADLHDHAVPADTVQAVERAMRRLSDSDREVLVLAANGGLSGETLGTALGTSASIAAKRLSRARSRLTEYYQQESGAQS